MSALTPERNTLLGNLGGILLGSATLVVLGILFLVTRIEDQHINFRWPELASLLSDIAENILETSSGVLGIWAAVLVALIAMIAGGQLTGAESRQREFSAIAVGASTTIAIASCTAALFLIIGFLVDPGPWASFLLSLSSYALIIMLGASAGLFTFRTDDAELSRAEFEKERVDTQRERLTPVPARSFVPFLLLSVAIPAGLACAIGVAAAGPVTRWLPAILLFAVVITVMVVAVHLGLGTLNAVEHTPAMRTLGMSFLVVTEIALILVSIGMIVGSSHTQRGMGVAFLFVCLAALASSLIRPRPAPAGRTYRNPLARFIRAGSINGYSALIADRILRARSQRLDTEIVTLRERLAEEDNARRKAAHPPTAVFRRSRTRSR